MARKVIHEGNFLRFIVDNGWEYVERTNCNGIVIVVCKNKEDKVIFVEQYRQPVQAKTIEFTAGLMNDEADINDETPLEAAKRELLEETGYEAASVEYLTSGPVSGGMSTNSVTMVLATDLTKVGEGGGVADENITVHEIPLDQTNQWLKEKEEQGYFVDPKVYSGLYFLNGYHLQ